MSMDWGLCPLVIAEDTEEDVGDEDDILHRRFARKV